MKLHGKKLTVIICLALIVVSLITAATVLVPRAQVESDDRDVALILDWAQIAESAQREGVGADVVVDKLVNAEGGALINGILYKEYVVSDLESMNFAYRMTGHEVMQNIDAGVYQLVDGAFSAGLDYIVCFSEAVADQVYAALDNKTNSTVLSATLLSPSGEQLYAVGTSMPAAELAALGVGFPEAVLEVAQKYDLAIAAQVRSFSVATKEAVDTAFSFPQGLNLVALGFNDSELPGANMNTEGWTAMQSLLKDKFNEFGLPLINAEFFKQKGFATFAEKIDYNIMRMHPVSEKELISLTADQVADRFALATSERNMRLALVRIPKNDIESNMTFLKEVKGAMEQKGLNMTSAPSHLPSMNVALWQVILLALGIAGGGCLLCLLLGLKKWSYVLAVLGFLGSVGLLFIGQAGLARKVLSLIAAIVFPTLSVYLVLGEKPSKNIITAAGKLFLMSALTMFGAFIMAALLSDSAYMNSTMTFSGVKIAQMVPLLLLVYLYFMRTNGGRKLLPQAKEICAKPVSIGLALIACVGLGLLAILMLRSGNDAVSVSTFEREFRAALDNYLLVRPRTKEFGFAHPLMLVMLYFGYKKYMLPLVFCAGIGQVSLMNTFSHLHTPLAASMLRTFNGVWLGVVLGAVLIGVICLIKKGIKNGRLLSEK